MVSETLDRTSGTLFPAPRQRPGDGKSNRKLEDTGRSMHGSLVRSLFLGSVLWEQPLLISRLPILYGGVWGSIVCVCVGVLIVQP